jgi:hypothetical protein
MYSIIAVTNKHTAKLYHVGSLYILYHFPCLCVHNCAPHFELIWESGGLFHSFTTCAQNKVEYSATYPDQFNLASTEEEDSGIPGLVWTLFKGENISYPCREKKHDSTIYSPSTPAAPGCSDV